MSGHVSMMTDVLITQMSTEMLRSSLRYIVSQDKVARQCLLDHIRRRYAESPVLMPPVTTLFPDERDVDALDAYLRNIRCLFSCHMVDECLPQCVCFHNGRLIVDEQSSLIYLVSAIKAAGATWQAGTPLERVLETFSHDIIQAVQAIKEAGHRSSIVEQQLVNLVEALKDCNTYCASHSLSNPLRRAHRQTHDAVKLLYPSADLLQSPDSTSAWPATAVGLDVKEMTESSRIQYTILGGSLRIPRLMNGLWQMSSPAWGSAGQSEMDHALLDLVRNGLVATDMADHYGDAELVFGAFRNSLPPDVVQHVVVATKWCVFAPLLDDPLEKTVLAAVKERVARVGGRVELLQFHWQDYSNPHFLPIIKHLVQLTQTRPDLVTAIGLCNFDARRTEEVCEYMIRETGGVGIVSNQVQFSLIDSRPLFGMTSVCEQYGLKLLTYGSLCGGFLSNRWLDRPPPDIYSQTNRLTPSQRKYWDMISAWGSWSDFQHLLHVLQAVAAEHRVEIANVATRWVLQQQAVGSVIVGTRLGVSSNVEANLRTFTFELSESQMITISDAALGEERTKGSSLYELVGDCGQEYR